MNLPTTQEIEALHKKYAPSDQAFTEIWQHCNIVKDIAMWCINNGLFTSIDSDLAAVGCLLHDVGVYKLYTQEGLLENTQYVTHGMLGYQILKAEGFNEVLCRFASHHTGVGITAKEIANNGLPLPKQDFLAETIEERLVMYADKFHSKDPAKFNSAAWYANNIESKFGSEKGKIFKQMIAEFGEPPIEAMAKSYNQQIR